MKMTLAQDLNSFDIKETKKNINAYFGNLEKLEWEKAKLRSQKGLTAKYQPTRKQIYQPYIRIGKDEFNLSALEAKDENIKRHITGFYWAQSILTKQEQVYIIEYFINGKYEREVVDLLGYNNTDDRAFRKLKRLAIYKFAYVLDLVV